MKTKIKMRMLGATIVMMAMLVGSAKAQMYNSTFEVIGYVIYEDKALEDEEFLDEDSVVVIEFHIEDNIRIYANRTYTLHTADGSFALDVTYKESFTTSEQRMTFLLNREAYNEFLIKGVGKLELSEYDVHFFTDSDKKWLAEFLALKSTGLREGESFADYD